MKESVQRDKNWSSKSLGARWQHNFFYGLLRYMGLRPAYLFSYIVVSYYILLKPEVYRRSQHYISRRFPRDGFFKRLRHTRRLVQNFAITLIDKSAVSILGRDAFTYKVNNSSRLREIIAEGKGLILLTSHTGCWQTAMSGIAAVDTPVHLLMYRDAGDVDNQYFEHSEQNHIRVIPVNDPLASMLKVTQALRKGEIVSIMGDRIFSPTAYIADVDFLGDRAFFPTAPYKIAASTGASLVLLLTKKVGFSTIEIDVVELGLPLEKKGKDFSVHAQEVATKIEEFTTESPYQFYNFFNLWSTQDEHHKD